MINKYKLTEEEIAILPEKLALAKMTYREIRKITDRLYISDETTDRITSTQTLFNIFTGISYETRQVEKLIKTEFHIAGKEKLEYNYIYRDNLELSRNKFLYSLPQYNLTSDIAHFTLYNPLGQPILKIKDLKLCKVHHKEYNVSDKLLFIYLKYRRKQSMGIVYDLQQDIMLDHYNGVIYILEDKYTSAIQVTRTTNGMDRVTLSYT